MITHIFAANFGYVRNKAAAIANKQTKQENSEEKKRARKNEKNAEHLVLLMRYQKHLCDACVNASLYRFFFVIWKKNTKRHTIICLHKQSRQ